MQRGGRFGRDGSKNVRKAALDGSKQELYAKDKTHGGTTTSLFQYLFVLMKNLKYPKFLIFPLQMYVVQEVSWGAEGWVAEPQPLCPCSASWVRGWSFPGLLSSLLHAPYGELWFCDYFDFKLFILT